MITYEELLARFFSLADEGYRAFHKKLLKNEKIVVIGVRMPLLRNLAKQLKGEVDSVLFFPNEYYEVGVLQCLLVSQLPFEAFCERVDSLVYRLDNWATCDGFDAKCIAKNREGFLPFVKKYLRDEREFVKRYALVVLLRNYMTQEYLPFIFESVIALKGEEYYEMMASAWLLCEVLIHFYDDGVAFLKHAKLSTAVQNKAIQKAKESFRLSVLQKESLNLLRK